MMTCMVLFPFERENQASAWMQAVPCYLVLWLENHVPSLFNLEAKKSVVPLPNSTPSIERLQTTEAHFREINLSAVRVTSNSCRFDEQCRFMTKDCFTQGISSYVDCKEL